MGDAKNNDLRVGFDSRLKLRFCGSQVTSRKLDENASQRARNSPKSATAYWQRPTQRIKIPMNYQLSIDAAGVESV